jgi:uncharacterized BrkB/YihY/UPF0761 family membrane protein
MDNFILYQLITLFIALYCSVNGVQVLNNTRNKIFEDNNIPKAMLYKHDWLIFYLGLNGTLFSIVLLNILLYIMAREGKPLSSAETAFFLLVQVIIITCNILLIYGGTNEIKKMRPIIDKDTQSRAAKGDV